jgi:plasmid maintenance system antidote protein VapI
VGEVFGVTRQRIEQIEKRALAKVGRLMMRLHPDWFGNAAEEWAREQNDAELQLAQARAWRILGRKFAVAVSRLFRAMGKLGAP